MDDRTKLTRRDMLAGVAALVTLPIAGSCGSKESNLVCSDTTGLTAAEIQTRTALGYKEQSPHADKTCDGCKFFTAPRQENGCGTCTIMRGKVHPKGYCNSWVVRPT